MKLLICTLSATFCISIWWIVFVERAENVLLTVTFLDVGQGDGILIEAPNGNQLLIDTGPNKKILESLGEVLPIYDKSIDGILLTHPDLDHIGGAVPILNTFKVDYLFTASSTKETEATAALDAINTADKKHLERGDKILLDIVNNIYVEILFPTNAFVKEESDANDHSVVAKLVYGDTCFLFTGDASKTVERFLIAQYGKRLDCDLLKAGHHGSDTSSDEMFIGFVAPKYAVISAGHDNTFGHPHKTVLDILEKFKVKVFETSKEGNIVFYSDGKVVWTPAQGRGVEQ